MVSVCGFFSKARKEAYHRFRSSSSGSIISLSRQLEFCWKTRSHTWPIQSRGQSMVGKQPLLFSDSTQSWVSSESVMSEESLVTDSTIDQRNMRH